MVMADALWGAPAITQDEKNARQTIVAAQANQAGNAVGLEPVDECGRDVFSGSRIVVSATSG
jgi:hypothetical protein